MIDRDRVAAALRDSLHTVAEIPADKVSPDASIVSLGLDSLRLSEVIMEVEALLSLELPEATLLRLNDATTVGAIEQIVSEALAAHEEKVA